MKTAHSSHWVNHRFFLLLLFVIGLTACRNSTAVGVINRDPNGKEPQNFPEIAAGAGHTCMLTTSGRVACWGANQFGQLGGGDGPYTALEQGPTLEISGAQSWVKTNVRGIPGKVTAIAAGDNHNCALIASGEVFCWGSNSAGQLGNGSTSDSNIAVQVTGLETRVKMISAGAQHTCVLLEDDTVLCWGDNREGQLGNGSTLNKLSPTEVQNLPDKISQITAGAAFTCALTHNGIVICWGNGDNGRFGEGLGTPTMIPTELKIGMDPVAEIEAGSFHICARLITKDVFCWGSISTERVFDPAHPFTLDRGKEEYVHLAAGGGHTCGLTTNDAVYCWGDNYFGQLGDGSDLGSWTPVNAMNLSGGVLRIFSGSGHVCAILLDNSVKCWGDCSNGQCGDSMLAWDWNTYTNRNYRFSLDYPREWDIMEVPNDGYPSNVDQVWFTLSEFPPSQSDARADLTLIITPEDPTPNWNVKYFDNYASKVIDLQNIQALRISGVNKESHAEETVLIIRTNDYYIQALPNNSPESLRYFDQIMYTFNLDFELGADAYITQPSCFTPLEINPFAISPEGDKLFVKGKNEIEVIDLENGEQKVIAKSTVDILSAEVSPNGQILAVSWQDGTIQLIRISDQAVLTNLSGQTDSAYHMLFSPVEDTLFSAGHDGLVHVWDFDGNKIKYIDTGVEVVGIGLSWDGSKLAIVPSEGPVQIWDLERDKKIAELGGTGGYDTSEAVFSPDGQYIAADLATGLYLWRVSDGELLWSDVQNSMAVAFSPDGQYLAYADIDNNNEVVFRSPDGIQFIQVVDQMQGPVWEMFFSQDSALFVVTDGLEIHVRDTGDGQLRYIGKNSCP